MASTGDMARGPSHVGAEPAEQWHGVEFPYHSDLDIAEYYKRYAETLLAVDESVGRVLDALRKRGELDSTLVIYMGDNGFAFGEHGLIDKRTAYEESMRVPMLVRCPDLFPGGKTVEQVIANIDVHANLSSPPPAWRASGLDRAKASFPFCKEADTLARHVAVRVLLGAKLPPDAHDTALRGDQIKYIRYQGIWDLDELYDIKEDPRETNNLINDPKYATIAKDMNAKLFQVLESTGGMSIPLYPDRGNQSRQRHPDRSKAADFPDALKSPPKTR